MNRKPKPSEGQPANIPGLNEESMDNAHQDLSETKKIITDLVQYRQSMISKKHGEAEDSKINEIRDKAIKAINHLFDEDTGEASV